MLCNCIYLRQVQPFTDLPHQVSLPAHATQKIKLQKKKNYKTKERERESQESEK